MTAANNSQLLFVMGMHRSGASILFDSLALHPEMEAHCEGPDSPFFELWWLKPEPVLRPLLSRPNQKVLIKAQSETQVRSVESVLAEFLDYDPKAVWIFRNPRDVWASNVRILGLTDQHMQAWLEMWNRSHESLLTAMVGEHGHRITLVRYEDLCQEPERMYFDLCATLDIRPAKCLFRDETITESPKLSKSTTWLIESGTSDVLGRLDERRSLVPTRTTLKQGLMPSHQ